MKRYILVAGVDYPHYTNALTPAHLRLPNMRYAVLPFRKYCNERAKQIQRENRKNKEDSTIQIFDFNSGQVITQITKFHGRTEKIGMAIPTKRKSPITIKNYACVVRKNQIWFRNFKNGQRDTLSIKDVYDEVELIGKYHRNELEQLHFFSHAYQKGPILVNSIDDRFETRGSKAYPLAPEERDPDDKDGRAGLDLKPKNIDLQNFMEAFSKSGYIWNWGCNNSQDLVSKVYKIMYDSVTTTFRKGYNNISVSDDSVFEFSDLNDEEFAFFSRNLKKSDALFPNKNSMIVKFKWLKWLVCDLALSTENYNYYVAQTAKVKVYGGPYGTSSTGDSHGMRIEEKFKEIVNFFANHLRFKFGEKSWYMLYAPERRCDPPTATGP